MLRPHVSPKIYLFVLWSEARREEDRIVADLAAHFTLLDLIDVTWTADETFARNLTRMYGDALPPGSEKEVHCGSGPFLAVVVEDRRPRFRVQRTGRGLRLVNDSIFTARCRYRTWTGGGYRVHASDSVAETNRNLALLFGVRSDGLRHRNIGDATVRHWKSDPIGTNGWDSVGQLGLVLAAHGGRVGRDGRAEHAMTVHTPDVWWAEHIAGGREIRTGVRELIVAGQPFELTILPSRGWATCHRRLNRMVQMLRDVQWLYPRAVTTVAVQTLAAGCALVARSLLPPKWRPERLYWVALTSPGAYVVLRLGGHTGWSKRFKHSVLDWFEGDVDDAQTWMLGILSSAGILVSVQLMRRCLGSMNVSTAKSRPHVSD